MKEDIKTWAAIGAVIIIIVAVAVGVALGIDKLKAELNKPVAVDHYEGQIHRLHVELNTAYEQIDDLYEQIESMEADLPEASPKDRRQQEIEYLLSQTTVMLSLDGVRVCLKEPVYGFIECKDTEEVFSDNDAVIYR